MCRGVGTTAVFSAMATAMGSEPGVLFPPPTRFLYAKLLLLLTELQTLKVENTRQILHIQDLSSMTPLLSEIIS